MAKKPAPVQDPEEVQERKLGRTTPKGQPGFDPPIDRKAPRVNALVKILDQEHTRLKVAQILVTENSRSLPLIEALAEVKKEK